MCITFEENWKLSLKIIHLFFISNLFKTLPLYTWFPFSNVSKVSHDNFSMHDYKMLNSYKESCVNTYLCRFPRVGFGKRILPLQKMHLKIGYEWYMWFGGVVFDSVQSVFHLLASRGAFGLKLNWDRSIHFSLILSWV